MAASYIRPLRIGEILDLAIKLFWRNAGTLLKIVVIVVVPLQVIAVLITLSTTPDVLQSSNAFVPPAPGETPVVESSELWTMLAGLLLLAVLSFMFLTLATGACFKAVTDAYLGVPPDWRASMRFAGSRLGSLLWVSFLTTLGATLALVACIAPGVWLWTAWAVAIPALMTEDARGTEAMRRSFRLVRHRWWPTFGALLVGYIFAAIIGSIIPALLSLVLFTDAGDSLLVSAVVNGAGNVISSVITTPFQAALTVIVYFDLRVRKEGFDLQLLAARVGVPLRPGTAPPAWEPAPVPQAPPGWYGPPPAAAPPYWPPPPGWTPSPAPGPWTPADEPPPLGPARPPEA